MEENPDLIPIRATLPTREEFDELVQRANGGDRQATGELRRLLDQHPEIWRRLGDLAAAAGTAFLNMASQDNQLVKGSISRYVRDLRKELLGPSPTPLERIAVERLVICWAQLNYVSAVVVSLKDVSPGTLSAWHKRQRQSSGELDKAIKCLATLRKLLPAAAERAPGRTRRA